MDEHITKYIKNLALNSPIDSAKFTEIIGSIDCNVPQEYLNFLRETNGGLGFILDGKYEDFIRVEYLIPSDLIRGYLLLDFKAIAELSASIPNCLLKPI
ncbi:hypothetical protein [Chitinophaga filiformis]|uniref:SMI1 / KNR4 family (SUKH-1) n=1 Tax=Chitinophaga filiformis TaxID=104663 RepID=A0ABY4I8R4_CHIFI|nr:hypothetical protein [Chitinophaga filiformis]UPK72486.1 hypothetical protein MYF79_14430 [Chitinophaga filiformis]